MAGTALPSPGAPAAGPPAPQQAPASLTYLLRPPDRLHRFGVSSLALTPEYLFTGGRDGVVRAWPVDGNGTLVRGDALKCVMQLDEHSDWVNGIVYMKHHQRLVSASSDTTLKVWGLGGGGMYCMETLKAHKDYVKAVDIVDDAQGIMASGSLDGRVLIWNLGNGKPVVLTHVSTDPGGKEDGALAQVGWSGGIGSVSKSIYALTAGRPKGLGPMVAAGGAHKFVHIWDLREDKNSGPAFSFASRRGGSTRALKMGVDTLLTGGGDQELILWDLKMGKIRTYVGTGHQDSVWALQRGLGSDNAEVVLSGGRDGRVYATHLQPEPVSEYGWHGKQVCIVEQADSDPRANRVLDLCATRDEKGVYVATTGSTVRLHPLKFPWDGDRHEFSSENGIRYKEENRKLSSDPMEGVVMARTPEKTEESKDPHMPIQVNDSYVGGEIRGIPGIVKYKVTNDRRRVVVMDSRGGVQVYDVTSGRIVEELELQATGGPGAKVNKVYGNENCEDELEKKWELIVEQFEKRKEEEVSVPGWFSVDIRTGSLGIKLDKSSIFNAEIYAKDAGMLRDIPEDCEDASTPNGTGSPAKRSREDTKFNIGEHVLRGLFSDWKERDLARTKRMQREKEQEQEQERERDRKRNRSKIEQNDSSSMDDDHLASSARGAKGTIGAATKGDRAAALSPKAAEQQEKTPPRTGPRKSLFKQYRYPRDVKVIIKEGNSPVPTLQKEIGKLTGEDAEVLPKWVVDVVRNDKPVEREPVKLSFGLTPAPGSNLPPLTQVNLTAPRILRIQRVSSYTRNHLAQMDKKETEGYRSISDLDENDIEILCGDKVLPKDMSLATARQFRWKSPDELKLTYRMRPGSGKPEK